MNVTRHHTEACPALDLNFEIAPLFEETDPGKCCSLNKSATKRG